jgi:hypothetical protein
VLLSVVFDTKTGFTSTYRTGRPTGSLNVRPLPRASKKIRDPKRNGTRYLSNSERSDGSLQGSSFGLQHKQSNVIYLLTVQYKDSSPRHTTTMTQTGLSHGQDGIQEHWIHTIAGVMGNVLEWYDFALFGFFSGK